MLVMAAVYNRRNSINSRKCDVLHLWWYAAALSHIRLLGILALVRRQASYTEPLMAYIFVEVWMGLTFLWSGKVLDGVLKRREVDHEREQLRRARELAMRKSGVGNSYRRVVARYHSNACQPGEEVVQFLPSAPPEHLVL